MTVQVVGRVLEGNDGHVGEVTVEDLDSDSQVVQRLLWFEFENTFRGMRNPGDELVPLLVQAMRAPQPQVQLNGLLGLVKLFRCVPKMWCARVYMSTAVSASPHRRAGRAGAWTGILIDSPPPQLCRYP